MGKKKEIRTVKQCLPIVYTKKYVMKSTLFATDYYTLLQLLVATNKAKGNLIIWVAVLFAIEQFFLDLSVHGYLVTCSPDIMSAGWLRGFIADYGVPLMVLVWTGISYIPSSNVPKGIPRRLFSPNPWSPGAYANWTVVKACISKSPFYRCFILII